MYSSPPRTLQYYGIFCADSRDIIKMKLISRLLHHRMLREILLTGLLYNTVLLAAILNSPCTGSWYCFIILEAQVFHCIYTHMDGRTIKWFDLTWLPNGFQQTAVECLHSAWFINKTLVSAKRKLTPWNEFNQKCRIVLKCLCTL